METTTDILNELTALSPVLAGMEKVNVFSVPTGYFESVSETILVCLREENGLINERGYNPLGEVPEGYFENLAFSILDKIKTGMNSEEEIRNLSPLLYSIQSKNVFEVPGGYFEKLHSNVFENIHAMTPKEELEIISPLLYNLQYEPVFEVPVGYFDGLETKILQKVQPPTAKVVALPGKTRFMKYAVAAMLTGALAIGLYKYFENQGTEINIDYAASSLDAYIEKGKNMDIKEFNEELESLTESDIALYLENNGNISDVVALGNSIGENNLPSLEDYLLDESTLENYLKNIELVTPNN